MEEFAKKTDHNTLEGEQYLTTLMVKCTNAAASSFHQSAQNISLSLGQCAQSITFSIEQFRQTTKVLGESSDKLSKKIFWLNIILVLATIVGVGAATFQAVSQIKEWNNVQEDRKFSTLFRLEDRLLNSTNQSIYSATEHNKPILKDNGGKFSTDDLDQYLNDLTSIESAYDRKLIDMSSAYEWFAEYFEMASQNKEVNDYLASIRKESPDYYDGFEAFSSEINAYGKR